MKKYRRFKTIAFDYSLNLKNGEKLHINIDMF